MNESTVATNKVKQDKMVKNDNTVELSDYYVNKPWKAIEDLPSHLPFSDEYKAYHTRALPRL